MLYEARRLAGTAVLLVCMLPLGAAARQGAAAPDTAQVKRTPPKLVYSVDPEYTKIAKKKK